MDFLIDGSSLSDVLGEQFPERNIAGLLPTTLNWLYSSAEQLIVWNRFLDRNSTHLTVPILCCPDELDFWCSLILVEVTIADDEVKWQRFGFDISESSLLPAGVGSQIDWLEGADVFTFDREQYDTAARNFQTWAETQLAE